MPEREEEQLAKEMEELEAALARDDDGEIEPPSKPSVETEEDLEAQGVEDETGQEAESGKDKPVEDGEAEETPDQTEQPTEEGQKEQPVLTTLPNDPETFGDLAGKRVTTEQLIQAGLIDKLVTWGHQGRHLVQKGQEEISEARKLRELLEKQFAKEEEQKDQAPQLSEAEFANQLVEKYMPDFKRVAAQGGIEEDFIKEFPKAAAHIENRLQSGAMLLRALIEEVGNIREGVAPIQEERIESQATGRFDKLMDSVGSTDSPIFTPLMDRKTRNEFFDWVTSEEAGLKITSKDVGEITQKDVTSAWLLYVHEHPNVIKAQKEPAPKDTHLAGGSGGSHGSSKTKTPRPKDDLSNFESEYTTSLESRFDD